MELLSGVSQIVTPRIGNATSCSRGTLNLADTTANYKQRMNNTVLDLPPHQKSLPQLRDHILIVRSVRNIRLRSHNKA